MFGEPGTQSKGIILCLFKMNSIYFFKWWGSNYCNSEDTVHFSIQAFGKHDHCFFSVSVVLSCW